jgi:light-regulated signal transduction histidine kinase (bacteriophytochrome)
VVACDTGELTRARQSLLAANGELTRLVNASEALAEKLQVQNDSLRHINYSISHIVRAPLANLLGLVNLINEQGIYHPDSQVFLQYLKTVADQLDDAIHDVVKENANGLQVHK